MTNEKLYNIAMKLSPVFKGRDFSSFYEETKKLYKKFPYYFEELGNTDYFKLFCFIFFISRNSTPPSLKSLIDKLSDCGLAYSFYTDFEDVVRVCDECGGSGEVDCENCNSGNVECPTCDGSGEDEEGDECDDCFGVGEVMCDLCDGVGSFDCDECDGKGENQDYGKTMISIKVSFIFSEDTKKYFSRLEKTSQANDEPMQIESQHILEMLDEFSIYNKSDFEIDKGVEYYYNFSQDFVNEVVYEPEVCGNMLRHFRMSGPFADFYVENSFSDILK